MQAVAFIFGFAGLQVSDGCIWSIDATIVSTMNWVAVIFGVASWLSSDGWVFSCTLDATIGLMMKVVVF